MPVIPKGRALTGYYCTACGTPADERAKDAFLRGEAIGCCPYATLILTAESEDKAIAWNRDVAHQLRKRPGSVLLGGTHGMWGVRGQYGIISHGDST